MGSAELKILTKVDFFSHMGSFEPVIDPFVINLTTERFKDPGPNPKSNPNPTDPNPNPNPRLGTGRAGLTPISS